MPITALAGYPDEDLTARGFKLGKDGIWTGNRKWKLRLDLSAATGAEVAAIESHVEALFPVARYDAHPGFAAAFVRTADAVPLALDLWDLTAGYSSEPLGGSAGATLAALPAGAATNAAAPSKNQDKSTPANQRHPEFWTDKQALKELLEADAQTGAPVRNAAGDPFDPPPEVDRTLAVFRFRKWKPSSTNWLTYLNYNDRINSAAVTVLGQTFAARTLRVLSCLPKLVWDTVDYGSGKTVSAVWEIEGSLPYDSREHKVRPMNAGKRQLVSGKPTNIKDKGGQDVSDPVPLTTTGAVLPVGGTVNYLSFSGYIEADFTELLS